MYPYLETIKLLDGEFFRLKYHLQRINYVGTMGVNLPDFDFEKLLRESDFPVSGLYKCRFLYGTEGYNISYKAYERRKIESLKLIELEIEKTPYKAADRSTYQSAFQLRNNCDDVLISTNGLITDSSYANVAFYDGHQWFTPAQPLIPGTNRAMLLEKKKIFLAEIKSDTLGNFEKIRIFNAMIEFGEIELPVSKITI